MQGIYGMANSMMSYILETRSTMAVGLCATACGLKVSQWAWDTIHNAVTWTDTCKGLMGVAVGTVAMSTGAAMALAGTGWSPLDDIDSGATTEYMANAACRWMDRQPECMEGRVTVTCDGSNNRKVRSNQQAMCEYLHHEGCGEYGFLIDCSGSEEYSAALHMFKEKE